MFVFSFRNFGHGARVLKLKETQFDGEEVGPRER